MFLRHPDFPDYVYKKHENNCAMFREGSDAPLKPIESKHEIKYKLYKNGHAQIITLFEFLKRALPKAS